MSILMSNARGEKKERKRNALRHSKVQIEQKQNWFRARMGYRIPKPKSGGFSLKPPPEAEGRGGSMLQLNSDAKAKDEEAGARRNGGTLERIRGRKAREADKEWRRRAEERGAAAFSLT